MPQNLTSLRDWPAWAAAVFLLLLLYRSQPVLGGWLLLLVAVGALVLLTNKGVFA